MSQIPAKKSTTCRPSRLSQAVLQTVRHVPRLGKTAWVSRLVILWALQTSEQTIQWFWRLYTTMPTFMKRGNGTSFRRLGVETRLVKTKKLPSGRHQSTSEQ